MNKTKPPMNDLANLLELPQYAHNGCHGQCIDSVSKIMKLCDYDAAKKGCIVFIRYVKRFVIDKVFSF